MPIPHVFLPVKKGDYNIRPFEAHKRYEVTQANYSSSGYTVRQGVFSSIPTPISSSKANNDPLNTDGTYQHIIWQGINHLYYKFPYDPTATLEHFNRRYTYKGLFLTASLISAPTLDFGERIKKSSVQISNSFYGLYLNDDGYGNVYDSKHITSSFADRNKLVAYWGFNDLYKATKYGRGSSGRLQIPYQSNTFQPDTVSKGKNISISTGVPVGVDGERTGSGLQVDFNGQTSTIVTRTNKYMNFPEGNDFTLAFWARLPISQSMTESFSTNTLISKRGSVEKQFYGNFPHTNADGTTIITKFLSQSIVNETNPVYPFQIEVYNQEDTDNNGKLIFKRSNGVQTLTIESSASYAGVGHTHFAIVKSGSIVSLYVNGTLEDDLIDGTESSCSGSDVSGETSNDNLLIFGADNVSFSKAFSGSLDEVRLYSYGLPSSSIKSLAERTTGSLYQTSVVGNTFYKSGTTVISSPIDKYQHIFDGSWNYKYRNTHTIYEHEVLCRLKAGDANLSMNPTARKNFQSDELINDFTGSLLKPYITTIGLYNDKGELLAVGKLGQAIRKRDDVNMNFILRWDI
jgi:hypothetical protein